VVVVVVVPHVGSVLETLHANLWRQASCSLHQTSVER